jgi:hypothetical protein
MIGSPFNQSYIGISCDECGPCSTESGVSVNDTAATLLVECRDGQVLKVVAYGGGGGGFIGAGICHGSVTEYNISSSSDF